MSHALKSLSLLTAAAVALAGAPLSSDARGATARSGSSAFFSEAGCWTPSGPTMTNGCSGFRAWHMPLLLDGSFNGWYNVTVTTTAVGAAGNVVCQLMSADKNGNTTMTTGFFQMPWFNAPADLTLSIWVGGGGTAMFDCFVNQGSRVHTLNY